jgi:hypothetical protein
MEYRRSGRTVSSRRKEADVKAVTLARRFAARVEELSGEKPVVKGKKEIEEHGWIPGAEASVVFEGHFYRPGTAGEIDLAELTLYEPYMTDEFFLEPYSGWLVGVYRR